MGMDTVPITHVNVPLDSNSTIRTCRQADKYNTNSTVFCEEVQLIVRFKKWHRYTEATETFSFGKCFILYVLRTWNEDMDRLCPSHYH